jgi:hypothetical protein
MPESNAPKESVNAKLRRITKGFLTRTRIRPRFAVYDSKTHALIGLFFDEQLTRGFMLYLLPRGSFYKDL